MLNPPRQIPLKKAALFVCFFLSLTQAFSIDPLWQFDPQLERIYRRVLNLQVEQAYAELAQLKNVNELHKIYVQSLIETVDILVTEDGKRFEKINEDIKKRIDRVSEMPESAEELFVRAELNLMRGFNMLNLDQEVNAVLAIRHAYQATQECIRKYPGFVPIKKTNGVIQVMVGSVPGKYQWVMSLLGMRGSVQVGQKQLEELRTSKSSLSMEATVVYFCVKGFINQQHAEAARGFQELLVKDPNSRLILFLGIDMLMHDSQSEKALELMHTLDKQPSGLPLYLVEYLRGEALLERGDYLQAIKAYQKFAKAYRSQSYKKDSYFKIGLCYVLMGDSENARRNFETAKVTGRTVTEPDRYAAAMLEDDALPNVKILRVRFYTDGGYYKEAGESIKAIVPADLLTPRDRTEFTYRKGRLAHKTQDLSSAKLFYQQTIDLTGTEPWYFAPNAALNLGYISQEQGDLASAKKYYQKALSYKNHEYKSGIDTRARAALETLKN